MNIAVLGAGNGGLATAAHLAQRGNLVRLWNRSAAPIDAVTRRGGIALSGALGETTVAIAVATTDIDRAVAGAEAVVTTLPATAHEAVATALSGSMSVGVPLILNPGHMCGSLRVRRAFEAAGIRTPPIAELGTLTYVCRTPVAGAVDVYLEARQVPVATVPHDDEVLKLVLDLFPGTRAAALPAESWFNDVNMVLHPPGMILGASRIQDPSASFKFYVEGVTGAVASVMERLDDERLSVGNAYGVLLPDLTHTMASFGTVEDPDGGLAAAIRGGGANAQIDAPTSLDHRYLHEDVGYGLVPFMALASAAGVETPVAAALTILAETITGRNYRLNGSNATALGIEGMTAAEVTALATGET
jgi:opine dehydrogenase